MKGPGWLILLAFSLTCSACSTLIQHIDPSTVQNGNTEPDRLYAEFSRRNASLVSFKGTGKATLFKNRKSFSARIAYAGAVPEKLRIELIGSPGQPKIGFSSDGQWLYYYDQNDASAPVKRISSADPSLWRFTSVSITSRDILSILSGRVPDYRYVTSELDPDPSSDGFMMVLRKRWWMGHLKIYLDAGKTHVTMIERVKGGTLVYRVKFNRMQSAGGYRIPKRLHIADQEGNHFELDIGRFWANAPVSKELFILKPPNP